MMMYVCVNLSWNVRSQTTLSLLLHHVAGVADGRHLWPAVIQISLLLLLKKGGAVFTFIGSAVSLPLSHFAFAISTRFFLFFTPPKSPLLMLLSVSRLAHHRFGDSQLGGRPRACPRLCRFVPSPTEQVLITQPTH